MAPPQLVSLENYSDVQFRDVFHRRSMLVASNTGSNVAQQLYHHYDGTTAKLSAAGLTTTDASGNAQYALMVSSNARSLDANTFTFSNVASWTANSVFTANATTLSVRVPTLSANAISASAISCQSLNLSNDVRFANVTATNLMVTGNLVVDTTTLTVDPQNNRVGVAVAGLPAHALDVVGNVNIGTGNVFKINGTDVLSGSALGSGVTSSSLQSVGTLGTLSVSGSATAGNVGCVGNMGNNAILAQGTHLAFNSEFNGHSELVNKRGAGDGGFSFYTSPGTSTSTELSVNTRLARMNVIGLEIGSRTFTGGNAVLTGGTSLMTALNLTGNVTAGNLSTNAISATAITTPTMNVTTGSLTAYGTNHVVDSTAFITLSRNITGTTIGTGWYLGNIVHLGACSTLEVDISGRVDGNNTVTKSYVIPISPDWYWTGWRRALPFTTNYNEQVTAFSDISLDLLWSSTQIDLAIARSRVSGLTLGCTVEVSMRIHFNKASGWNPAQHFVPRASSYNSQLGGTVATANILASTIMTQTGDNTLGIRKYRPNAMYAMDVAGTVNFDNAVYCRGGIQVDGGLNYTGNLVLDGVQVTNTGLIFGPSLSPVWRLYYNSTTQNLEIHQSNNGNPTWNDFTVTGILAAK